MSESPPANPTVLNPGAIVFDMDGLLLNTEILARRALRLAGAELGMDLPESLCERMIGVPADGCRQLLFERYGDGCEPDQLLAASARHLHAQIAAGELKLLPGVRELLAHLRHHEVPHAIATSSSREKARHHLEAAGLLNVFGTVVTRDDVARGKPFPDLYLEAARRLCVPPRQCLALEDSYNGVRAAHAAGMPVIMVPDLLRPTPEMQRMCLAIMRDLHAVMTMLTLENSAQSHA
jgi:HAD superfamily hydrolase (TIGR01509 family)